MVMLLGFVALMNEIVKGVLRMPRLCSFLPVLVLFLVFAFTMPAESIEPIEKTDLFLQSDNGVALYRIPGLVVTPKGTVLAYAEARRNPRGDWGEIEVHLRRS